MNLEESDKFVEQQRKTEQKKKIVLVSIVLCAILVALLIILIIYIQYQDSLKLKMYVDGNQVKITANMLKQDGDTSYVNIKAFSEMLGYTYTKGEYKKYNENIDSCYIKNNLEVVAMTAESETLTKYIEVVEGAPELTEEGPYGMQMQVESKNGESNTFVLSKTVKLIDDELYLPFDYLTDVYNILVDTSTPNRIRLYTLPTLFQSAKQKAVALEYTTISGVYENIRAIPYGLIVVGNNGIYGVIESGGQGKEILSVKYENLEFLQNSQEFFMRAENTVGLLDKTGATIIQPRDYDDIAILDEIEQLYLVEKDRKYGVVNRKGEIVLHVDYDAIGLKNIKDFEEENVGDRNLLFDKCIVVELDDSYGLYDITGKELLKPVYEGFGCVSDVSGEDSVLMVPKEVGVEGLVINFNGLYAIYDIEKEEIVIPAVYSKIYSVTKAGETNYYAQFGDEQLNLKDVLKNVQASSTEQPSEETTDEVEEPTEDNEIVQETESEEVIVE